MAVIIQPALPMVDYVVNYKHISEDLCVNKDKPEMHCNGKCHLKKEIKKAMGEDENPAKKKYTLNNKLKEYADYYRRSTIVKYFLKRTFQLTENTIIIKNPFKGYLSQLIKPPEFVS